MTKPKPSQGGFYGELHMKDYINDQDFIKWQKKHARKIAVAEGLKIFAILGLIMLLLALCTTAISMALNTPEVEYSWETKECKRVVYMDGSTTDCSVLPPRYDRVWVK